MTPLPTALAELLCDPDGKRAEACMLSVIHDLERSGIKPRQIGLAFSRVMLGFCAEQGREPSKFGWANSVLKDTGDLLENRAHAARRRWVRKFMSKTGRLYKDASYAIEIEIPAVKDALDARLNILESQGQA